MQLVQVVAGAENLGRSVAEVAVGMPTLRELELLEHERDANVVGYLCLC